MRVLFVILLSCFAIGCNSDPRCRRETALLRAEILDLEDKYYLLKSQHQNQLSQISNGTIQGEIYSDAHGIADGQILDGSIVGQPYYTDTGEIYSGQIDGDIIYDNGSRLNTAAPTSLSDYPISVDNAHPSVLSSDMSPNRLTQPRINSPTSNNPMPTDQGQGRSVIQPANESQIDTFEDLRMPELEDPTDLEGSSNPSRRQPGQLTLDGPEFSVGYDNRATESPIVTEVKINRDATRGHDVDGIPGDEGIDLLIQPKTADGSVEFLAGELTVSVIDPSQTAALQRIGLWKFLPEETELFFANDELGNQGILLHLPWDQSTPINSRLIVHVRFIAPDGRILKTSSELRVTPPTENYSVDDPLVAGWTKRDSRWIPNPALDAAERESDWVRSQNHNRIRVQTSPFDLNPSPARTRIKATPVKTRSKPRWRPVR